MKRLLFLTFAVIFVWIGIDYLYYYSGILYLPHTGEVSYLSKAEGEQLYRVAEGEFQEFSIRGVNMGLGKPGYYATEYSITKEEYLRWFSQMQEMGANILRVYTLAKPEFYEAFYEYNQGRENPLYLIHGVWVDDYLINSTYSALDKEFSEPFLRDCKVIVDVIHGRYKKGDNASVFPDRYKWDISEWVYGYIIGIEWESTLVTYTNGYCEQEPQYDGTYFYTEGAENFEIFLATVGDQMIDYETRKYGTQRVFAFSNWATTDPLDHDDSVEEYFEKSACVDVEHIKCKETFVPGQFASYHIYPYYPDYYSFLDEHEENTYLQYLKEINDHHSMPVVISEFGVSSSRAMAAVEEGLGRNQGAMSETEQGEALISMYEDIMAAGSNGGIVFTWQDEWFKRTWNTMANINLDATPYWSDYQTNEQYFGLLSFDPGKNESICYVDGDKSDWKEADHILRSSEGISLSMKYDEKFIYFLVEKEKFSIQEDTIYLVLDTTPKSGTFEAENLPVSADTEMDFVIEIDGKENSRVWVQEYYDTMSALFYEEVSSDNFFSKVFPERDTGKFTEIELLLQKYMYYEMVEYGHSNPETDIPLKFSEFDPNYAYHYRVSARYETGKLTYGNANPKAEEFNSLADFCAGDGFVEIKVPWQLLNFADPSNMYIHDDYYEYFGVEYIKIDSMNVGAGTGEGTIITEKFPLKPLGKNPEYHERLKESYYILKDYWTQTLQ